jgi:hypothetical protein
MKTIKVTQEDINKGCVKDASNCPIALAIRREFPEDDHVTVDTWRIRVYDGSGRYTTHNTPMIAKIFITRFDSHLHVEPFEFDLV